MQEIHTDSKQNAAHKASDRRRNVVDLVFWEVLRDEDAILRESFCVSVCECA